MMNCIAPLRCGAAGRLGRAWVCVRAGWDAYAQGELCVGRAKS